MYDVTSVSSSVCSSYVCTEDLVCTGDSALTGLGALSWTPNAFPTTGSAISSCSSTRLPVPLEWDLT